MRARWNIVGAASIAATFLSAVIFLHACGESGDRSSTSTSALTGSGGSGSDDPASVVGSGSDSNVLPASAAGTSTESGPGVPADFTGTITDSLPISQRQQQATARANALFTARNPPGQSPIDRGFGAVPVIEKGGLP